MTTVEKTIRLFALTMCLAALPLTVAAAQDAPQPQARGRAGGNAAGLSPAEVLNMLDAYALVQAEKALELKDTQYGEFVSRLKRLQDTRRRNLIARNRMVQELRRLTGPQAKPAEEHTLRDRLNALKEHDERSAVELARAYATLEEVLDIRQQVRFRVFEEALERRKIDLLMRARRGAAERQGQ
jgi:DNA repair ATPase RecN